MYRYGHPKFPHPSYTVSIRRLPFQLCWRLESQNWLFLSGCEQHRLLPYSWVCAFRSRADCKYFRGCYMLWVTENYIVINGIEKKRKIKLACWPQRFFPHHCQCLSLPQLPSTPSWGEASLNGIKKESWLRSLQIDAFMEYLWDTHC